MDCQFSGCPPDVLTFSLGFPAAVLWADPCACVVGRRLGWVLDSWGCVPQFWTLEGVIRWLFVSTVNPAGTEGYSPTKDDPTVKPKRKVSECDTRACDFLPAAIPVTEDSAPATAGSGTPTKNYAVAATGDSEIVEAAVVQRLASNLDP